MIRRRNRRMDLTNYTYREAVGKLKNLLAESYAQEKYGSLRDDDSIDDYSTSYKIFTDISKRFPTNFQSRSANIIKKIHHSSKENLLVPAKYISPEIETYYPPNKIRESPDMFNYVGKHNDDYIEQLEREPLYTKGDLSNLLEKVRDVINDNEALSINPSYRMTTKSSNPITNDTTIEKLPNHNNQFDTNGPNILFQSRISELEAELAQCSIDLKKIRNENIELKRKLSTTTDKDTTRSAEDGYCRQIENLQRDKLNLEEEIRKLKNIIDGLQSDQNNQKGYASKKQQSLIDIALFEKSQAEMEVKHLRDELERQHERLRDLQHEMTKRIAEERANAERRYNFQVDQLGGDLSSQWEQVTKLQIDLERQKRIQADLKRDLSQRNAQIDDLKAELKTKKATFLSEISQLNAEKQYLEQEMQTIRLQLERSERQSKVEAAKFNAEINALRQRLDRAEIDLLSAKQENLRLIDEMSDLKKEMTPEELKIRTDLRSSTRDLNKTVTEMQKQYDERVRELEGMIQSQQQLMEKLTKECKMLTNKLEDSTLKHKSELSTLQSDVSFLTNKFGTNDKNRIITTDISSKIPIEKESVSFAPQNETFDTNKVGYVPQKDTFDTSKVGYVPQKETFDTGKVGYVPQKETFDTSKVGYIPQKDSYDVNKSLTTPSSQSSIVSPPTSLQPTKKSVSFDLPKEQDEIKSTPITTGLDEAYEKTYEYASDGEKFETVDTPSYTGKTDYDTSTLLPTTSGTDNFNISETNVTEYPMQTTDAEYTDQYDQNYDPTQQYNENSYGTNYSDQYQQNYDENQQYQQYEQQDQYQLGDQSGEQFTGVDGNQMYNIGQEQYDPTNYGTEYDQTYQSDSTLYDQNQSVGISNLETTSMQDQSAAYPINPISTAETVSSEQNLPIQTDTSSKSKTMGSTVIRDNSKEGDNLKK